MIEAEGHATIIAHRYTRSRRERMPSTLAA